MIGSGVFEVVTYSQPAQRTEKTPKVPPTAQRPRFACTIVCKDRIFNFIYGPHNTDLVAVYRPI